MLQHIMVLGTDGSMADVALQDSSVVQVANLVGGPVDCVPLEGTGIDMWVFDRTVVGTPWHENVNLIATAVHSLFGGKSTTFYGPVVFTSNRVDLINQTVEIDGLTTEQHNELTETIRMFQRTYGYNDKAM